MMHGMISIPFKTCLISFCILTLSIWFPLTVGCPISSVPMVLTLIFLLRNLPPNQNSMSIKALQTKIGVTPDGAFGPNTIKAAMAYYKMTPVRAARKTFPLYSR